MIEDKQAENGDEEKMSKPPPQPLVKYTLAPLVRDGRNCLVCRDVEGMEWVVLEEVEFYYGGSPWQRLIRKSDDIFALVERGIFQWPAVERVTRARFRVRLQSALRARQITVRPCVRILSVEDEAGTILENWLKKRKFMEEQRGEGQSVE